MAAPVLSRNGVYRKYQLKKKYGMTPEQFDTMLEAQGGRCAVCLSDDPGTRRRFFVDHCHNTKAVRGILCHHCNSAIGLFKDSTATLTRAIQYLRCLETKT